MIETEIENKVNRLQKFWNYKPARLLVIAAAVFFVLYGVLTWAGNSYDSWKYKRDSEKSDQRIDRLDANANTFTGSAENTLGKSEETLRRAEAVEKKVKDSKRRSEELERKADVQKNNLNSNSDFKPRSGVTSAELDSLLRSAESPAPER